MRHLIVDMSQVESDRSLASEARLKRRVDAEVAKAIEKLFASRAVTDLTNAGSVTVKIRLDEPTFTFDRDTGDPTFVIPGNPQYYVGDHIRKPSKGGAGGSGGGAGFGETKDEYSFDAPTEELERRLFEDLRLPDMQLKQIVRISETTIERAGFQPDGAPANLDLVRSAVRSVGRRKAFGRPSLHMLRQAEDDLEELLGGDQSDSTAAAIAELERSIARMRSRRKTTPYMDKADLKYRRTQKVEIPISQAVVFNLMDKSGSMTEHHKKLAKQFFWLLRRLISLEYKEVDIVWIKHTDTAKETQEKDFFFGNDSGGTVVSTALEKMLEIVHTRYPLHLWNIYACQATDGDTWMNFQGENDAIVSAALLEEQILPIVQYFAYVECWDRDPAHIRKGGAATTPLWEAYQAMNRPLKFQMRQVHSSEQIYPVFANLFRDSSTRRRIAV